MNIVGICITGFLICIILFFPRRWAALAVVSGVLYLTQGQSVLIGNINFYSLRFIECAGMLRVLLRREVRIYNINNLDKAFFIYNTLYLLIYLIRCIFYIDSRYLIQYQIGGFIDGSFIYILFRGLIDSDDKLTLFLKDTVLLLIPFTVFMILEGITGENIFSYMGGVPETPVFRNGYYRCQASFRHAILAGSVGATMLPLFLIINFVGDKYAKSRLGIIMCIIIVFASHSSGPIMAISFGIMAWMFWPLRKNMRIVRYWIMGILISLHLIMKAPIWFLISRISDIIGGDGWHRANLINKWVGSLGKSWFWGMSWYNTENWAATTMPWGAVDATNEYINIAINGGIVSLILFVALIRKCYLNLGKKMEEAREKGIKQSELICWGLGASLTSHILNFMSVSYWDQFYVFWYMLLAIISGVTMARHVEIIIPMSESIHIN